MLKRFDDSNDINDVIEDAYGSKAGLAQILESGLELLLFIESDTFQQRDIQNVATAIRIASEFLRQND
jgi:glutathione S-transferase